jgi:histidinol phosphatase-like enzyme (inositol monophosphatase family)
MDTHHFLEFGLATITKARALILDKSRKGFSVSIKVDDTVVTEVDRETELLIRKEIQHTFPTHGIVGEEYGNHNEQAEYKWYLDPIDGTISFSHGIPLYGTILALHHGDTPLVGIIDHPGLGLCYYASQGNGTFCNGERITMQGVLENFNKEIIATGDLKQFDDSNTFEAYQQLVKDHKLVRTLPDCFGHTLAAKGSVGAMVDFHLNIWDLAATKIIIEEAGGKFVLLNKWKNAHGIFKYNIICGKPEVVDWVGKYF